MIKSILLAIFWGLVAFATGAIVTFVSYDKNHLPPQYITLYLIASATIGLLLFASIVWNDWAERKEKQQR